MRDRRLAAVIDFGTCGIGDPACDVVVAWTLLHGQARATFRRVLGADGTLWSLGRGWALWKALVTLVPAPEASVEAQARRVIEAVLADHAEA